jgi:hypothetical protein
VALATDSRYPAERLVAALTGKGSFLLLVHPETVSPLGWLKTRLLMKDEDCMGFTKTVLTAALFDDAVRRKWMRKVEKFMRWKCIQDHKGRV